MGDYLRAPYEEVPLGDTYEVIWQLFFEQYAFALPEWARERLLDSVAVAQAATEESCAQLRREVKRLTPTLGVHAARPDRVLLRVDAHDEQVLAGGAGQLRAQDGRVLAAVRAVHARDDGHDRSPSRRFASCRRECERP